MSASTPIAVSDNLISQTVCTMPGQISVTVRHWLVGSLSGGGVVDFGDIATGLSVALAAVYKPIMTNPAQYYGTAVRRFAPIVTAPPSWAYSISGQGAGSAGATPLPTQSAGLAKFETGFIGRGGRLYIPFPATADTESDGTPTASYITRAQALALVFAQDISITGASGTIAVLSPLIYHKPAASFVLVKGRTVANAWATQKRRGSFGRLNSLPW